MTYVAQQRLTYPSIPWTGSWNDLPVADTLQGAKNEIAQNKLALAATRSKSEVEYRIVRREETVIEEDS